VSQAAPIPARFYPAGGDAHGHPALVELVGDVLQVLPEDSPPRQVPLAGLQAARASTTASGPSPGPPKAVASTCC
jgi:hypothetical protein